MKSCLKKRSPIKLEAYVRILNLNNTGPMAIPRTKRETFANNTRAYRSPWSGILDYEPGIDEILGWVDEYDDEDYGDDDGDDGQYDDFDDDDDGGMLGFSSDEVQELLAQGVKPWDDDAADVMAALRSF
ncbi:hypothetical protein EIP86_008471 [Pleurotus ostreatoroseus]|nr:hypothetical protein EIP86_008471 [Pleurotus ostreatoroseus]